MDIHISSPPPPPMGNMPERVAQKYPVYTFFSLQYKEYITFHQC